MEISVAIQTYNHEKYIAQCLESIICQKFDEDWEIVLLDDCSKDNTEQIYNRILKNSGIPFRLIRNNENLGVNLSYKKLIESCKGKFVAYCDGDDFWLTKDKLQKQYNLIKSNKGVFCVAKSEIWNEDVNEKLGNYNGPKDKNVSFSYFEKGGYLQTSTYLMHRAYLLQSIEEMIHFPCCITDIVPRYILSEKGNSVFLDEFVSIYRITNKGYWSEKNDFEKMLDFQIFYNNLYKIRNNQIYYRQLVKSNREIIKYYFRKYKFNKLLIFALKNYKNIIL